MRLSISFGAVKNDSKVSMAYRKKSFAHAACQLGVVLVSCLSTAVPWAVALSRRGWSKTLLSLLLLHSQISAFISDIVF